MKVLYKITYPNGKIYIGKDLTNTLNYFGNADSKLIEKDFSLEERKLFSAPKEILFESEDTNEVNKKEVELVRETKGHRNPNLLQFPNEKRKIDCSTKHFKLSEVDYKQIKGDEIKWW